MAEFISTFTTGFSSVVEQNLPRMIKGVKLLHIFDGLVHYKFDGNSRDLEKVIYFNNTFFVFKTLSGKNLGFKALVNAFCGSKPLFLISKGSFRVRFSQENQFAKVDKNLTRRIEETVLRSSKLTIDRVSPSTEIWLSIRSEGFAFCGQLIFKRNFTEKNLNKGELRPELAYLLCEFSGVGDMCRAMLEENKLPVILDPFAGYGSIPLQLSKNYRFEKLYVSDLDSEKISILNQKKALQLDNVEITCEDAFSLKNIPDNSVNLVITDPPWGYYEDIGDIKDFYKKMFVSFKRILAPGGKMVILSARTEQLLSAAGDCGLKEEKSLHTLVNGKKASVYLF